MILGTVELGLNYGINNTCGKPSREQSLELLNTAWNLNIRELDTAAAYGDSEEIIGVYQESTGRKFLIDTKLPVLITPEKSVTYLVDESYKRLRTQSIHVLYLHAFEQCRDKKLLQLLQEQKDQGRIQHIGVSIYDPDEMQYIFDNCPNVDVIQFPFNALDNHRWQGYFSRKSGKKLYVRSVFLQGLIFKSPSDSFIISLGASEYIAELHRLAHEAHISMAELAYHYVKEFAEIDGIIIGCQSAEDVVNNVNVAGSDIRLSKDTMQKINELSQNIPEIIINPRKWSK